MNKQEHKGACAVCYGTGFDVNGKPCAVGCRAALQPTEQPEDERERFEAWANEIDSKGFDRYWAWQAWQAAKRDAAQAQQHDAIADAIHYPGCWDTAAYPTAADALKAVFEHYRCTNDEHAPQERAVVHDAIVYGLGLGIIKPDGSIEHVSQEAIRAAQSEDDRERFELSYRATHDCVDTSRRKDGQYNDWDMQISWNGWRAGKHDAVSSIDELIASHKRDTGGECDADCQIVEGMEAARDYVIRVLTQQAEGE